jgi:hypothetical protein
MSGGGMAKTQEEKTFTASQIMKWSGWEVARAIIYGAIKSGDYEAAKTWYAQAHRLRFPDEWEGFGMGLTCEQILSAARQSKSYVKGEKTKELVELLKEVHVAPKEREIAKCFLGAEGKSVLEDFEQDVVDEVRRKVSEEEFERVVDLEYETFFSLDQIPRNFNSFPIKLIRALSARHLEGSESQFWGAMELIQQWKRRALNEKTEAHLEEWMTKAEPWLIKTFESLRRSDQWNTVGLAKAELERRILGAQSGLTSDGSAKKKSKAL